MTLFKKINSSLFGLFLLVMTIIVYFQFTQVRDFMSKQMASDLSNTATSLSLMLKPQVESGDLITAETLVNVVFEGGFYRKVTLTWLADDKSQVWENSVVIKGVPQWFINLGLFKPQTETRLITSGWLQLANLEIEGHPALGYQELWRIMNNTLMILSLLFIIAVFTLRFRLKRILQPLHNIATQAREISQRKFDNEIPLPSTSELTDVVEAMNVMSGQLKQIFSTLDNEVDSLKKDSLVDDVSELPNRQYFSANVKSWLQEPGIGGLMLINLDFLEEIQSKYGYQGRDDVIKLLSKAMKTELPKVTDSIIARIAKNEFAFLITQAEKSTIEVYLQSLIRVINQEINKAGVTPNTGFNIGISQRIPKMSASDLLTQSDNALQQARRENKVSHWIDSKETQKYSREQWRSKLTSAINNNRFVFQWQPILSMKNHEVIQREIYCRLTIDDKIATAAEFMPFIEMLSLGSELDKCLLQTIEHQNIFSRSSQPVAINLSLESLLSNEFYLWLQAFLQKLSLTDHICFEMPEFALRNNFDACYRLARVVKSAGAKVGVDQCGRQLGSLEYLQKLQPDYIKLDQSFSFYEKEDHNHGLYRAVINVAKGLNINVIVTGIENKEQLTSVSSLAADGYQGYIVSPEDLPR